MDRSHAGTPQELIAL